jgi:hypothetical protein
VRPLAFGHFPWIRGFEAWSLGWFVGFIRIHLGSNGEKTEFVLGANFGTPYGSGSQLIFWLMAVVAVTLVEEEVAVTEKRIIDC